MAEHAEVGRRLALHHEHRAVEVGPDLLQEPTHVRALVGRPEEVEQADRDDRDGGERGDGGDGPRRAPGARAASTRAPRSPAAPR